MCTRVARDGAHLIAEEFLEHLAILEVDRDVDLARNVMVVKVELRQELREEFAGIEAGGPGSRSCRALRGWTIGAAVPTWFVARSASGTLVPRVRGTRSARNKHRSAGNGFAPRGHSSPCAKFRQSSQKNSRRSRTLPPRMWKRLTASMWFSK